MGLELSRSIQRGGIILEKKILDVTCGSRTIWFDKSHPAALYCDRRRETYKNLWKSTNAKSERDCTIDPDVLCDFTNLPFEDNSLASGWTMATG